MTIATIEKKFLVKVISEKQKRTLILLISFWLINLIWFWYWWLQAKHMIDWWGISLCSIFLFWNTVIPFYYFYFVLRMRKPNPCLPLPDDWRVAMVVTKAPSEPWYIVKKTLQAMLAQKYPHDTWLADEDPQPDVINWCEQNGVKISTRKGIAEYHRQTWPRRTKCKEGNLAYFYDHFGYNNYDFVVQMDADHCPTQGYLEEMLRGFLDVRVGYVAAPSICSANSHQSWAVRGRLYGEANMHGSLQAGYNHGWAPLCIGSHYAVRTSALKEIGGLGAELAEDHTTTLMMNGHGWRGVFALDAIAYGEGPASFLDCMIQEFQWSRSLTIVLFTITPKYFKGLKPHLQFQFLFAQLWYIIFGLSAIFGLSLPIMALLIDHSWVQVNYLEFMGRSLILNLSCMFPVLYIKRCGCFRPIDGKIISWETMLFQITRSAWIFAGVFNALFCLLLRTQVQFKITPKGQQKTKPLPTIIMLPYLSISGLTSLVVILANQIENAKGYYFLCLLTSAIYLIVSFSLIYNHRRENQLKGKKRLKYYGLFTLVFIIFISACLLKLNTSIKSILEHNNNEKKEFIYK